LTNLYQKRNRLTREKGVSILALDKEERRLHTDLKNTKGGKDGRPMDCQYQYVPANPSDRNGFLPHHPVECIDPVAEEGITSLQRE
jgi:hypothetical protein